MLLTVGAPAVKSGLSLKTYWYIAKFVSAVTLASLFLCIAPALHVIVCLIAFAVHRFHVAVTAQLPWNVFDIYVVRKCALLDNRRRFWLVMS